jgi:DNA primase DnaG DnaB-binding
VEGPPPEPGAGARTRSPDRELEMEALKILAQAPEIAAGFVEHITEANFTGDRKKAWALLRESPGQAAALADRAVDEATSRLIAQLAVEPLRGDPTRDYAGKVFAKLQERALREEVRTMRKRLEALNPVRDAPTFDPLFRELAELTGRWREARARAGEGA